MRLMGEGESIRRWAQMDADKRMMKMMGGKYSGHFGG